MAATITNTRIRSKNNYLTSFSEVNLGTYATGGVSVTPAQLGLERVDHYIIWQKVIAGSTAAQSAVYMYDATNSKILSHGANLGQTTNGTNLANVTLNVLAFQFS